MQPTLYLMVGYPGSGKTTVANHIHALTGAQHIWADKERVALFGEPRFGSQESKQLYAKLNKHTVDLLAQGKSVIFDTDFRFRKDRDYLRQLAEEAGADVKLIWLTTDKALAMKRATEEAENQPTRIMGNMPLESFHRTATHIEPPTDDEHPIKINGVGVTQEIVATAIGFTKAS